MNSQRRLAVALAEAIENYLNEFGRRTGTSSGGSDGR
jgi:hypothetical protein